MRKKLPILLVLALVAVLAAVLAGGLLNAAPQAEPPAIKVEVSLTNLTRGQIMSPVFAVIHDESAEPLYVLGEPASDALAKMAEDADASGLMSMYGDAMMMMGESMPQYSTMNFGEGPIPPGETVTLSFDASEETRWMSFVSMLVSTNDAFIGANAIDLEESQTIYLAAYDSGSEANSEDCAYIPGPPCGNHVVDRSPSEGYVHVHAGIHGHAHPEIYAHIHEAHGEGIGGDHDLDDHAYDGLDPAEHDWRNPVARLEIRSWHATWHEHD